MSSVVPVILCGGSGARLWPLSRAGFPKQFLCLGGSETLFQLSIKRLLGVASDKVKVSAPVIVAGENYRFLVLEQLREMGVELNTAILEPAARNTAPALTLAALEALESGDDPILVVTPCDHALKNTDAYTVAIQSAIERAVSGSIVMLGIIPDQPETGYGYIKSSGSLDISPALKVEKFVEKPDLSTAQSYIQEGNYYWNAGIFVLRASVWMKALNRFRPDIAEATSLAWEKRHMDEKFIRPGEAEFFKIPSESIDYAVMEPLAQQEDKFSIEMIPLDAGWSDLGSWDAVWNISPKDEGNNVYFGDVLSVKSNNNLVHSSGRLVSLVGVENLVIVETSDAVLVAHKSNSQEVKRIVSMLDASGRREHQEHLSPCNSFK